MTVRDHTFTTQYRPPNYDFPPADWALLEDDSEVWAARDEYDRRTFALVSHAVQERKRP